MVPEEGAVQGGEMGGEDMSSSPGVWRLRISSIRQTGCRQRQRVNESKLPGKEYKQIRPWVRRPFYVFCIPHQLFLMFC